MDSHFLFFFFVHLFELARVVLRNRGEKLAVEIAESGEEAGKEKKGSEELFLREAGHLKGDDFMVRIEIKKDSHGGEEKREGEKELEEARKGVEVVERDGRKSGGGKKVNSIDR